MLNLPDFPWDELASAKAVAAAHPHGLIDLSVGSPVEDTPSSVQHALAEASNAPGYPTVRGSEATRQALAHWWVTRRGASTVTAEGVFPTIGSKEAVGLLPLLLGLKEGASVVHPAIAYPTYAVGAAVAGADAVAEDDPEKWPDSTALVWLNSPSNPTGEVVDVPKLRAAVERARELGAVIANDECYAMLGSESVPEAPSILSDDVTQGDNSGVLALYSLSKQSSMAGYRAAMMAGDDDIIGQIVHVRRHLGLMAPAPVQSALVTGLADTGTVEETRSRYQQRRRLLQPALEAAGFSVTGGDAGLYIWATAGKLSMDSVNELAQHGILAAPGHFYGPGGAQHVRVALTASNDQIRAAADRLQAAS